MVIPVVVLVSAGDAKECYELAIEINMVSANVSGGGNHIEVVVVTFPLIPHSSEYDG